MSIESKDHSPVSGRVCNVMYSKVTEVLLESPVTRTAGAFQHLYPNDEAPPLIQRASLKLPIDVQTFLEDLRSLHTDFARFLKCLSQNVRPKAAFPFNGFSDHLSGAEEVLILDVAVLCTVQVQLKPKVTTTGQLEEQRSSHRTFFLC